MTQPGYDALAHRYATTFPDAYRSSIERHAVNAFAEGIDAVGAVIDVGCGTGHVTADLARRGLTTIGCDPSPAMLAIARSTYPDLTFVEADASLVGVDDPIAAIIARFSLIHIPPDDVGEVFQQWADRVRPGTSVLIAGQSSDIAGAATEFDHAVAPAWRWHPDELGRALGTTGFDQEWRIVNRPDAANRFPTVHVLAHRR